MRPGEGGKILIEKPVSGNSNASPEIIEPYKVSAEILKSIKGTIINEFLTGSSVNDKIKAVITVPAQFNADQRNETKKAAEEVGIEVIGMLNEPTSAAIAYAFCGGIDDLKKNQTLMVFDLGGGTFDCTIMDVIENGGRPIYKVIYSNGNGHLGGVDIDNKIYKHVMDQLKADYEDVYEDLFGKNVRDRKRNNTICSLKLTAQKTKDNFSTDKKATFSFSNVVQDGVVPEFDIEKDFWDKIVGEVTNKCLKTIDETLRKAKRKEEDIKTIIMVGGSCKITEISDLVQNRFKKSRLIHSQAFSKQLAVTAGACIEAYRINLNSNIYSVEGVDLTDEYITKKTKTLEELSGMKYKEVVFDSKINKNIEFFMIISIRNISLRFMIKDNILMGT